MQNIQFIDRKDELKMLKKLADDDEDVFLIVRGRRRIGKTTLLKKAYPDATYIFIWPDKSMQWIVDEVCKEHGLPHFSSFIDILLYLLDKNQMIILDEFQNFLNIDKSIFGEIQKLIDERRIKKKPYKMVVCGSSYSLINKLFNSAASPLYGRRTHDVALGELPIAELYLSLKMSTSAKAGKGLEEFAKIWSVFGGVPYYYTTMEQGPTIEKMMAGMIKRGDPMLMDEGKVILSIEFGKDSKTYNTVLAAISEGKTKLHEISSYFSGKKGEAIKYLDTLRKEFNLVRRMTPILADPAKSREGVYEINDNFLSFWFYFIDKKKAYFEQGRFDEVVRFFDQNFPNYVGRMFERFITELARRKILFPAHNFTRLGRQWGRASGKESGKDQYEIDIVAVDDATGEIFFCECKWQDRVDAEKIAEELAEKSGCAIWNNDKRKEHFAVFARSFSARTTEYKGSPVDCFDLKDVEKAIKSWKRREK
jgi:AAA+ ATPase superfamily predicted ATPase